MYIPTWLIISVIILGIYCFAKSRKGDSNLDNMPNIFKQRYSYKLDIHIAPNWYKLYKKLCNPINEEEWEKSLKQKINNLERDDGSLNLWGRNYYFTEYYDSSSGLTTRFQRIIRHNGSQYFYPVDKFGDRGYIFDSDSNGIRSKEQLDAAEILSIAIGEDFIRNDIFDKYIGGPKSDFDYEKENYIFQFPLCDVFTFLFALGWRFNGAERHRIIKWPDQIENKFKEFGIDYETHFDYDPKPFDIEKHDKKFYEKWGKPSICLYSHKGIDNAAFLVTKDKTYYDVELKIFRPGENERVG